MNNSTMGLKLHSIKKSMLLSRFVVSRAEVFYGANYWSPIITSKNSSENLSNHNKHLCFCTVFSSFCCLQDKTWIKMPKWTIFLISSKQFVLITENFWRIFWRDNWPSIIGAVENYRYCVKHFQKSHITCLLSA